MHDHAIAQSHIGIEDGIRMQRALLSENTIASHIDARVQNALAVDHNAIVNIHPRIDVAAGTNPGRRADDRPRRDADVRDGRFRPKFAGQSNARVLRIVDKHEHGRKACQQAVVAKFATDQTGAGARRYQVSQMFLVDRERDVVRPRLVNSSHPVNRERGISLHLTPNAQR